MANKQAMWRFYRAFSLVMGLMLLNACALRNTPVVTFQADGNYDTEFPAANCAAQIEQAGSSIRLLNSIAYYKSYKFDENQRILLKDIDKNILNTKSEKITYFNNTASGTATVILSDPLKIAFLTCTHIIDFPDTIIHYLDIEGQRRQFIQSIAFKEMQSNYITDLPAGEDLEVLLKDKGNDIAILGRRFSSPQNEIIPVFPFKLGKARDLQWGSFVYLMGFPRGYKMVTHGLVSDPRRGRDGSFLVDALFNRGFSGGIVLAIRDGVPNFELVGMAKSAAAEYQVVIKPPENIDLSRYDIQTPYTGELYLETRADIQYGITNIVAIETILNVLRQNQKRLANLGYDFSEFLRK